jgi:ribA/ribD-fused uncharacterized protein
MTNLAAPPVISSFSGHWRFLSNFGELPAPMWFAGMPWLTSEHAYQMGKVTGPDDMRWIADAPTPLEAKHRGRAVTCRPDWDQIKRAHMLQVVTAKFQHPVLRGKLLSTELAVLIEGNGWHDDYWGAVPGTKTPTGRLWRTGDPDAPYLAGRNWLGRILMTVRELMAIETPEIP